MSISFNEFLTALDAKETGSSGQYAAHCPVPSHGKGRGDRNRSFSITQHLGRVLVYCHAHCSQEAVLDALEGRQLWPVETDQSAARKVRIEEVAAKLELPPGLIEFATKLVDPKNGVVERYLRARGIEVTDLNDIGQHPKAWHKPSDTWWPCMVGCVRDINNRPRSLHRTWLHHIDPIKAPVEPNRMLYLGGEAKGNAIHLAPAAETMLLGEGIESTASAMILFGLPGWSGISAGFMPHVVLPDIVQNITICADNDEPGLQAATEAAQRFRREGRQVRVVKPGTCDDFNSLLMRQHGLSPPSAAQAAGGRLS